MDRLALEALNGGGIRAVQMQSEPAGTQAVVALHTGSKVTRLCGGGGRGSILTRWKPGSPAHLEARRNEGRRPVSRRGRFNAHDITASDLSLQPAVQSLGRN